MHILRRLLVVILICVLPLLLLLTALNVGIVETVSNPTQVLKIINGSGVYNNLASAVLDQAQQQTDGGGSVSLTDPVVKSAAVATFSPRFLKQTTETIVNGTYDWLNGKVTLPDFNINLGNKKAEFSSLVAANARQLATSLPACSRAQTLALSNQGSNFDVFNATCLPIGTTPDSVASNIQSNLTDNQNFLKSPILTANAIKKSGSNQSVFSGKASNAPTAFQWLKQTPFILSGLSLLAIIGIVFISSNRRKGLKRVGVVLTVIGVIVLVYAWGFNYGLTKKALPKIHISNTVISSDVKTIATEITHTVDKYYWLFGGVYLALGVIAITAAWKYPRSASTKGNAAVAQSGPLHNDQDPAIPPQPHPAAPKIDL